MYAEATSSLGVPFFHLGSWDIGIPIQAFGVIVAAGVLIGAALLRRYAEWHGVSDDHIRGLLGWITICGFIGAHVFDVVAYQWGELERDPVLLLKVWDGISSYGGFIGGAGGFAFYVWWKRLPVRLFADVSIVGLLPAFSIGRIGCTVVSDHIGAVVDRANWYAALAMNYPRDPAVENFPLVQEAVNARDPDTGKYLYPPGAGESLHQGSIAMWNLGLVEFLYLVPVNALVLWLAFRPGKRPNAGFLAVLTGVLYAPVRFFMDYLRPTDTDPRHLGLTFAQWASLLAFGVAVYAASRIMKGGEPAETVTRTSGEAQAKLRVILKDEDEKAEDAKAKGTSVPAKKPAAKKPAKPADEGAEVSAKEVAKAAEKKGEDKKADKKPEDKAAEKAAEKKAEKKAAEKKGEDKKTEKAAEKKAEKTEEKKAEKKAEDKTAEKKAEDKKTEKAEDKAAEKRTEDKKAEKAEAEDKKSEEKKSEES